jgi:hypothetical protein
MSKQVRKYVQCPECQKEMRSDKLKTHINSKHVKKTHKCSQCDDDHDFKTSSNLNRHINSAHQTKQSKVYQCGLCITKVKCLICQEVILESEIRKHETTSLNTTVNIPLYFKKKNIAYNKHNNLMYKMQTRKTENRRLKHDLNDLNNVYEPYVTKYQRNYGKTTIDDQTDDETDEEPIAKKDEYYECMTQEFYDKLTGAYKYDKDVDFPIHQDQLSDIHLSPDGFEMKCDWMSEYEENIVRLKYNSDNQCVELFDNDDFVYDRFFYEYL